MNILSGLLARDSIKDELKKFFALLSVRPKLCIVQIGDRQDSNIYVRNKKSFGEDVGVEVSVLNFNTIDNDSFKGIIDGLNNDASVKGIIIQLPLPEYIDKSILDRIDAKKDCDCLGRENRSRFYSNIKPFIIPATARAILNILNFYKFELKDKKVAVFGRSELVGKPTATLLEREGALVSVIHSKTDNPKEISKSSDIVVVAIGKPEAIDGSYFRADNSQVVIDVGIHKIMTLGVAKTVGDVNFEDVSKMVSCISPVPGGVGPVTVSSLFQNIADMLKSES